jgi:hypothetical protein
VSELRPAPTDTAWLLMEPVGRQERRAQRRFWERVQLNTDIARLEFQCGLIDELPDHIEIDGVRCPVPTLPDPGRSERR